MHKSIYNQNIVYLFTNYKGQKYIGSKTNCIVENNKILQKGNKPYFTSSTNKEFKQSLETHEYKLEILFTTLDKTINIVEKERYYQLKYDVLNNNEFVNKTICYEKFNNIGYVSCYDKISKTLKHVTKEEFDNNENLIGSTYGMVAVKNIITNEFLSVTKEEFDNNENLISVSVGKNNNLVSALDINTNRTIKVTKEEFDNNDNLVGVAKGLLTALNLSTGLKERITKEFYYKNKDNYQCVGGAGRGVNKRKMTCYDLKKNKFVRIDTDVYLKNKNTRYLSPTSSAYKKLFSIC